LLEAAGETTVTQSQAQAAIEVLKVANLGGAVSLTKNFTSAESLAFTVRPTYLAPIGSSTAALPTQVRAAAELRYTNRFDRTDSITVAVGGDVARYSTEGAQV